MQTSQEGFLVTIEPLQKFASNRTVNGGYPKMLLKKGGEMKFSFNTVAFSQRKFYIQKGDNLKMWRGDPQNT